jgi:hypothetical protein
MEEAGLRRRDTSAYMRKTSTTAPRVRKREREKKERVKKMEGSKREREEREKDLREASDI